jgi:hypothetical protein
MKLPKNLRGKYVSRAAFAKMQAEKQRLQNDIRVIVHGGAEGLKVWAKWRKHYNFWDEMNAALKEIAKKELPGLLERINKQNSKPTP